MLCKYGKPNVTLSPAFVNLMEERLLIATKQFVCLWPFDDYCANAEKGIKLIDYNRN